MSRLKLLYRIFLLLLLILIPAFAFQSLRASPPSGAVVQTWHYDPQTNVVTATVVNVSHKDITGYNISVKETYVDGHVNSHEVLCDYVGRIVLLQQVQGTADEAGIRKQFGDGLFHPGESRTEIFGVQPGLQNFEAVVDVTAYADQTADATNNDGLQRLLVHRKASLAATQAANDIIKTALADTNDANPAATAATKLQARIAAWKAQQNRDIEPGEVQGMVARLQETSRHTDKRGDLQQFVARKDAQVATLSPHANLKRIGGPQ